MDDKHLNYLISRYLEGACTPDELDMLLDFIHENQDDIRLRSLMDLHGEKPSSPVEEDKLQDAYRKVDRSFEKIWRTSPQPRIRVKRYALAAASIVALLSVAVWYWTSGSWVAEHYETETYVSSKPSTLTLPDGTHLFLAESIVEPKSLYESGDITIWQVAGEELRIDRPSRSRDTQKWVELKTAKGKKMKVNLGDSTIAWINANSTFRFPTQFVNRERLVDLNGEAYFEVKHSKERPFFVQGTDQLIKVYGTRFNVRNYVDEYKNSVTLFEGKLSVRKKRKEGYTEEKILAPGEHIDLHKSSELIEVSSISNETQRVAWLSDRKYYDNATLTDIFMDLSHQYEINIDWQNIPPLRFQGYLPHGRNLDETLQIISTTAGIRITKDNNVITF